GPEGARRACEDNAFALLRAADGRVASIHSSWMHWQGYLYLEIFGTHGTLVVDNDQIQGEVSHHVFDRHGDPIASTIERPALAKPDPSWRRHLQELVDAIREGRDPSPCGWDGLRVSRMVDALYRSAASARWSAFRPMRPPRRGTGPRAAAPAGLDLPADGPPPSGTTPGSRSLEPRAGGADAARPVPTWEAAALAAILLVAFFLRIYGLRWALPGRTDLNPDEQVVLQIIARMSWTHLDPGAYFYGGFFYEACLLVRSVLRALDPGIRDASLVLAYRGVSVMFGTATVAVLYGLLCRVAPPGPAPLLGAAFLALMPLHVWDSHFAVTDITLTFWMIAAVAAAVRAYQRPTAGRFAAASALVGAATGTKFNGAF